MTLRAGVAKLVGAALAGSLLIFAAPAAAKPCDPQRPGGNSEIAQYLETIPGPCGDQPIGGNGTGDPGTSSGPGSGSSAAGLPPATLSRLESLGPEGAQAAGFAQATNPGGGGAQGSGGSSSSAESGTTSDDGGSLLSALERLLTGNDASASGGQGLGTWLPILLVAVLLGGFATLAVRRGRTG